MSLEAAQVRGVDLLPAADHLLGRLRGTSFSTYVPHTVRTRETKGCVDCHVAESGDNNAWMAQLLMQGTGLVNFIGRYAYVGEGHHGFEAVW